MYHQRKKNIGWTPTQGQPPNHGIGCRTNSGSRRDILKLYLHASTNGMSENDINELTYYGKDLSLISTVRKYKLI